MEQLVSITITGCSLEERFAESLENMEHQAVLSLGPHERAGSQGPLLHRMRVFICRLQVPYASSFPFPLSKHVDFQVLCCGSFD
jgi:hypothetical protein